MFACRFDPIRRTKDDSVAASNHDIVKEERDEIYKGESGKETCESER
jgi:hypothetical protein